MPTATERNRFRKSDPGADNNTWGSFLNSAMFDLIDDSLDGFVEVSSSGTTTLTNTQYVENQARMRVIKYSALSSGTLILPNVEKWYIVYAEVADVVISAGSATTATVKAGDITLVICDGADCWRVQTNNLNGVELKGVTAPTTNTSAANKAYVDGLAFAAGGALPGINSGTVDQFVTNNGTTAYWGDVLPTRSSGTLSQTLKSLGTANGSVISTTWDWDGFQGVVDKSSNYTVVLADRQKWINCTAAITLDLTATGTLGSKFIFRVINATTSSSVTVDPNGSELINGTSTLTVLPGEVWDIVSTGTAWVAKNVVQTPSAWDVIIQDQKASGTDGQAFTPTAINTRVLNTVVRSTITGVSLASNQITLPPGIWRIFARSPVNAGTSSRLMLYNVTDAAYAILGPNGSTATSATIQTDATFDSYLTITASKTFELRHFVGASAGTGGTKINDGNPEIYTQFFAQRVSP